MYFLQKANKMVS